MSHQDRNQLADIIDMPYLTQAHDDHDEDHDDYEDAVLRGDARADSSHAGGELFHAVELEVRKERRDDNGSVLFFWKNFSC